MIPENMSTCILCIKHNVSSHADCKNIMSPCILPIEHNVPTHTSCKNIMSTCILPVKHNVPSNTTYLYLVVYLFGNCRWWFNYWLEHPHCWMISFSSFVSFRQRNEKWCITTLVTIIDIPWIIGVLGNNSAPLRLYWADDIQTLWNIMSYKIKMR